MVENSEIRSVHPYLRGNSLHTFQIPTSMHGRHESRTLRIPTTANTEEPGSLRMMPMNAEGQLQNNTYACHRREANAFGSTAYGGQRARTLSEVATGSTYKTPTPIPVSNSAHHEEPSSLPSFRRHPSNFTKRQDVSRSSDSEHKQRFGHPTIRTLQNVQARSWPRLPAAGVSFQSASGTDTLVVGHDPYSRNQSNADAADSIEVQLDDDAWSDQISINAVNHHFDTLPESTSHRSGISTRTHGIEVQLDGDAWSDQISVNAVKHHFDTIQGILRSSPPTRSRYYRVGATATVWTRWMGQLTSNTHKRPHCSALMRVRLHDTDARYGCKSNPHGVLPPPPMHSQDTSHVQLDATDVSHGCQPNPHRLWPPTPMNDADTMNSQTTVGARIHATDASYGCRPYPHGFWPQIPSLVCRDATLTFSVTKLHSDLNPTPSGLNRPLSFYAGTIQFSIDAGSIPDPYPALSVSTPTRDVRATPAPYPALSVSTPTRDVPNGLFSIYAGARHLRFDAGSNPDPHPFGQAWPSPVRSLYRHSALRTTNRPQPNRTTDRHSAFRSHIKTPVSDKNTRNPTNLNFHQAPEDRNKFSHEDRKKFFPEDRNNPQQDRNKFLLDKAASVIANPRLTLNSACLVRPENTNDPASLVRPENTNANSQTGWRPSIYAGSMATSVIHIHYPTPRLEKAHARNAAPVKNTASSVRLENPTALSAKAPSTASSVRLEPSSDDTDVGADDSYGCNKTPTPISITDHPRIISYQAPGPTPSMVSGPSTAASSAFMQQTEVVEDHG